MNILMIFDVNQFQQAPPPPGGGKGSSADISYLRYQISDVAADAVRVCPMASGFGKEGRLHHSSRLGLIGCADL